MIFIRSIEVFTSNNIHVHTFHQLRQDIQYIVLVVAYFVHRLNQDILCMYSSQLLPFYLTTLIKNDETQKLWHLTTTKSTQTNNKNEIYFCTNNFRGFKVCSFMILSHSSTFLLKTKISKLIERRWNLISYLQNTGIDHFIVYLSTKYTRQS